ncbi:MAG: hypothetical protein FJ147_23310 [Deltaproteobacteria bacterium]|nr:hypothetical protein [Deltaproteobacteria bacterium]
MKLTKVFLATLLATGISVVAVGNWARAEQGAEQKTEGSDTTHAKPACCMHKEAKEENPQVHSGAACCMKKEAKGEAQGQSAVNETGSDAHECSHDKAQGGDRHVEKLEEGTH